MFEAMLTISIEPKPVFEKDNSAIPAANNIQLNSATCRTRATKGLELSRLLV